MAIVGQGITAYPQPDDALNENSKNPVQNKVVAKEVGDLKSAVNGLKPVEYSTKTEITADKDVSFANSTVGWLLSDGSVDGTKSDFCVSDYIPLDGVKKIFRYNVPTKYNLEAYALYDKNKYMIPGTYHGRTTSYDFTTYKSYNYVVFYDISAEGAAYIRITKDVTLAYLFAEEYVAGVNYTIPGELHTDNIDETEDAVADFGETIGLLNKKMLEAKRFVLFRSDRDSWAENTYIDPINGSIKTGSAYYLYAASDYIPVEAETLYATGQGYSYACYDTDKSMIPNGYGKLFSTNNALRGTQKYWFTTTPANTAYIRICFANPTVSVCGLQKVPDDYEILCLGDSIFGVNPCCFDISTIAQEKTGYRIANSGFGGSQASTFPDSSSPYYSFNLWKIADAIYDEDFAEQDASAATIEASDGSILYVSRLTILESVDFTKVKLIAIGHGTNDYSKNTVLDNENNKYDKTTYLGAIRYSMEKIWSKYPKIRFALFSPPYGRKGTNNEYSTDTWENGIGLKLTDYVAALKELAEEYHVAFVDRYTNMGVNDINWEVYLRDGTHLTYIDGANLFGAQMAKAVDGILSEYP